MVLGEEIWKCSNRQLKSVLTNGDSHSHRYLQNLRIMHLVNSLEMHHTLIKKRNFSLTKTIDRCESYLCASLRTTPLRLTGRVEV